MPDHAQARTGAQRYQGATQDVGAPGAVEEAQSLAVASCCAYDAELSAALLPDVTQDEVLSSATV